ncbi:MAG: PEP-CTERM sorting domain-containing protein [Phycisphaerae bacterium]
MRGFALLAVVTVLTALASPPALGGTWYVPFGGQVPGGFDHIQILMAYPYEFDSPAMSAFCGPSPVGEDWSQTFLNDNRDFATADGPSPGDEAIHFAIWIGGDRLVDRPAFHFQTYLGETRVGNADVICWGPEELDWMVAPGTWTQNSPIPPWLPGDADRDTDVDIYDIINHWQPNYTGPGATGKEWEDGDWDGDGDVDIFDALNCWQVNYTGPHTPEPATIALTALGAAAVMAARRRNR